MDMRFQNASGGEWQAEAAPAFFFEDQSFADTAPALWEKAPWLAIAPALRDFSAKKDEITVLYGHPDLPLARVIACGLGKVKDFKLEAFRNAAAKAAALGAKQGYASLGISAENLGLVAKAAGLPREVLAGEAALAVKLGLYKLDTYRAKAEEEKPRPARLSFFFSEKETPDADHRAVRRAEAEADGISLARDLANGPPNIITPEALAEEARRLAAAHRFKITVMGPKEITDLGMGAFWAVAQGAKREPRFIVLEHCPKGKETDRPLVLVGKGITFDTGGISLKPAPKMHEMKADMSGAAAVLGFFKALGGFADSDELPRVVGVIPATENMPDGNATRPGDVVTTLSGKTVEILNTDAEGRLILCDALTYVQREYNPALVVDIATLTGACVVALGEAGTAVFTDDGPLRRAVMDSAEFTGDLFWPLPLWMEYDDTLKSDVADFANMGVREGASIIAALFLKRFIEEGTRWAHLDIAGPAYIAKGSPLRPVPGASGLGVRLFCALHRNLHSI